MSQFNRRQFLALGAASAGTVFTANLLRNSDRGKIISASSVPQSYISQDGLLEIDLQASQHQINIAGRQGTLLAYNGQVPAPRLEAKPGDTVRLHFTNNLSQPTNLHYHGLHISPSGKADNVFLHISPGEKFTYEFTIPKNHQGGTFWYHPHVHGYVAEQLLGGLAGLFVVRGALDEIPEIKAATEQFLVLKDFDLDRENYIIPPVGGGRMAGREGRVLTVNGEINPTFSVPTGGLLRLRLLNASSSRFYRLALANHPVYLMATDGGAISEPLELTELLLVPGERAELLIPGNQQPGAYQLINLPYSRGGMGMMSGGMMDRNPIPSQQTLATITYSDAVNSVSLPKQLLPVPTLPEPDKIRRFELNHGMIPGQGMAFLINRQMFNPQRVDTQVKLNAIEDWELINTGVMDHPFHIHVNDFQILSRNGKTAAYRAWKDTVNVSPGEMVRIRIPFRDYTGKTVYHCHILDHEDLGMMSQMEIQS